MAAKPHAENNRSFDFAGPAGPVRIDIAGGVIRIVNGKKNLSIEEEQLQRIEYHPVPGVSGLPSLSSGFDFSYRDGGLQGKAEIALAADDPRTFHFLQDLKGRFPCQSCIGTNDNEKERVLSTRWRGTYGLHALHILTPAGIVTGLLLVLALAVILAESMPARAVSNETLLQALFAFLGLALVPASLMALIAAKVLMTLLTDHKGLALRRVFVSRKLSWEDVDWRAAIRRLQCLHGIVLLLLGPGQRRLFAEPCRNPASAWRKRNATLRLNLEEAGPLFRELYYRGKVTLETAQKVGAFI